MPASVMPEGRSEIDHAIYNAVMLKLKNPGHLKLLLQPDDHFIMKLLTFASKEKASLKIDHILCLNNMETVTSSKKPYNLLCLKHYASLYAAILIIHIADIQITYIPQQYFQPSSLSDPDLRLCHCIICGYGIGCYTDKSIIDFLTECF